MGICCSNPGALKTGRIVLLSDEMLVINVSCVLGNDALLVDCLRLHIIKSLFIDGVCIVGPIRKRSTNSIVLNHGLIYTSRVRNT